MRTKPLPPTFQPELVEFRPKDALESKVPSTNTAPGDVPLIRSAGGVAGILVWSAGEGATPPPPLFGAALVTVTVYVVVNRGSDAVTTTEMTFAPTFTGMEVDGDPEMTLTEFTSTLAAPEFVVGVSVTAVTLLFTFAT